MHSGNIPIELYGTYGAALHVSNIMRIFKERIFTTSVRLCVSLEEM